MIRVKDGQAIKLTQGQVAALVLASVLIVSATGAVAYATLSATGKFGSHGKIIAVGLQVFENAALTSEAKAIEWGELAPGGSATCQLWVKNNGTVPIVLSMSAGDWVPLIAQQYVSYSWNCTPGTVLQRDQVLAVVITISINQYIIGVEDFANNLYIIATKC